MTDKKISPHIERFKTLQDYAQYFIDEKGKTPNVSCVDEPVEVVKFAEKKLHPDYIRTGNDTYNVVVYDDFDYSSTSSFTPSSQVCTESILYLYEYSSSSGAYSQRDFIVAPRPEPSNGIDSVMKYLYPTNIFEDFEGTITRSVNLDSTTKYNASTKASYKAIHRTLGNKDINIFQISCASEKVALNEKIEFPGGYMYYPSPVYTIEGMNDDVILDDGFSFGGHTAKIIKQDDRHFILALGDTAALPNNKFELPAIMIPFHYKDLPELTFFKYFSDVNLPALYEEKPQTEFEFYLNIYNTPQKVEANDLVYKQYSPGFNVTYEGKKLYADYMIEQIEGDNKMLGSVELDGSELPQGMPTYLWETTELTSGAHELVAYDGEHNEIGRMAFNVKMPQFDYVLYDTNKNVIEPDEISRYVIDESNLNNDYFIDIHGEYDGKIYQGVSSLWANDNMFNEEITDWRDYIVLSPKVNNHNLEAYNDGDAAGASKLFKMKPTWCTSDTRYNIMDESNNIAEICFYYETFTPYLENGDLTVANLWKINNGLYYRPTNYFYYVDEYGQRNKVELSAISDNPLVATYDTNIIEPSIFNILGTKVTGWAFKKNIDIPAGDYKITNAYLEYNGLRLDLWSEATLTHADNPSTYIMKNANDEIINDLSWTYNSSDATATKTSEPFKIIKHDIDDDPQEVDITREVTASIYSDRDYEASLFNIEFSDVDEGGYRSIRITPKAELNTIRIYSAGAITFSYNNNSIKFIGNNYYTPQNGPMQIYIADDAAIDFMDREIHSFTSSADKTLIYDSYSTYCDDPNYKGDSVVQTITTTGTGITVEYPFTDNAPTGFKLTLQPNASGTITIAYQQAQGTDFVPAPRTYNITAPQSTKTDYLDYKALTEGGWGNRKLYGIDNNVDSGNGTYEFAIFDESGANHTFNYTLDVQGNAEIISTTTTDAGDPRGEGLVLIYKIRISGQASLTFSANDTPYVAVRFNA